MPFFAKRATCWLRRRRSCPGAWRKDSRFTPSFSPFHSIATTAAPPSSLAAFHSIATTADGKSEGGGWRPPARVDHECSLNQPSHVSVLCLSSAWNRIDRSDLRHHQRRPQHRGDSSGFDQATNITLDESHERVYSTKLHLME